jgi:hypothetical protein
MFDASRLELSWRFDGANGNFSRLSASCRRESSLYQFVENGSCAVVRHRLFILHVWLSLTASSTVRVIQVVEHDDISRCAQLQSVTLR